MVEGDSSCTDEFCRLGCKHLRVRSQVVKYASKERRKQDALLSLWSTMIQEQQATELSGVIIDQPSNDAPKGQVLSKVKDLRRRRNLFPSSIGSIEYDRLNNY